MTQTKRRVGGERKCRQQEAKEGKEISERKNDTGKAYCQEYREGIGTCI